MFTCNHDLILFSALFSEGLPSS